MPELECLSPAQVESYRRDGFVVMRSRVPTDLIAQCHGEIDRFVEEARGLRASNERLDLEDGHSPEAPRLRRIKLPHTLCPIFERLMRSDWALAPVRDLIGPDLRLHSSKLNVKSAAFGAPIHWHQDFAFYPHTNDDLLAVGVMLDEVTPDNGPLMVFPGTHRGPIFDHHCGGVFAGAVDLADCGLNSDEAVGLTGSAGTISLHHVRLLHGSEQNRSARDRSMLFYEIACSDAFPIMGAMSALTTLQAYDSKLLCGVGTLEPRLEPVPVRIPLPQPRTQGSIYEIQRARTPGSR